MHQLAQLTALWVFLVLLMGVIRDAPRIRLLVPWLLDASLVPVDGIRSPDFELGLVPFKLPLQKGCEFFIARFGSFDVLRVNCRFYQAELHEFRKQLGL